MRARAAVDASQPELVIIVLGDPGPQGSKSFKGMRGGHAIMQESSKKVAPWRDSVMWCTRIALAGRQMFQGPVQVDMIFTVRKPKGAPKTRRTWPAVPPDLSKLARSTEDALTLAGAYEDDSRIVEYGRLAKVYPGEDPDALDSLGCVIRIRGVR